MKSKLKMQTATGVTITWEEGGEFIVETPDFRRLTGIEGLITEAHQRQPYGSHLPAVELAKRAVLEILTRAEVVTIMGEDESLTPEEGEA